MKIMYWSGQSGVGELLTELLKEGEHRRLASIVEKIAYIANNGGVARPPIAKTLRGVGGTMGEIRCQWKEGELLRMYYFVDRRDLTMYLLNYIVKPDGRRQPSMYEGIQGKKLRRHIAQSVTRALSIKKQYPPHHHSYYELII